MMRTGLLTLVLVLASACSGTATETAATPEDPRPALSFTDWTETTELFIELRALVVGQDSPCAAHVTRLADFSALAEGTVTVVLRDASTEERFETEVPTVPGIFRPIARPTSAGSRRLLVEIRAEGISVVHDLGEVTVFASVEEAIAAIPEEPEPAGRITFLKEQQWPIEFGTAVASERSMRDSLRATGNTRARSDGEVLITAPVAGRVAAYGEVFPVLGREVQVDEVLALIAPRLDAADLASLELAVTSATLESRFAQRELERVEGLRTAGAIPESRVAQAQVLADQTRAQVTSASRRLAQFRRVQRTTGGGQGSVLLRAPLAGTVTELLAAPGAFVEAGDPLLRITDLHRLWLEVLVPEVDASQLGTPSGASFLVEGASIPVELSADALVARGHAIDPVTQTLPLYFEFDNTTLALPTGALARVALMRGDERRVLAVRASALVDDGGIFVVFVEVEGEAFERRVVRLGARDQGFVELLSGVRIGEHVVTRGAWSVKLAASSGSIPAHGHSH